MKTPMTPMWVVLGSSPDQPTQPAEVYLGRDGAEAYLLNGLFGAFQSAIGTIEKGGTVSLIINRGAEDSPTSSGSFVINNPGGLRKVWDFTVLEYQAEPVQAVES